MLLWIKPLPDPYPKSSTQFHRFLPSWNHWAWNPRSKYNYPPFNETFNTGPLIGVAHKLVPYSVNRYGYLYPIEKHKRTAGDEIRIAVVGGSTVECIALQPEKRWPTVLEELLGKEYEGRRISVLNLGLSGESTPTHLATVAQHAAKLDLDAVIYMLGANELHRVGEDWDPMLDKRSFSEVAGIRPSFLFFATRIQLGRRLWGLSNYFKPQFNEMDNPAFEKRAYFSELVVQRMNYPELPFEPVFKETALGDYELDIVTLSTIAKAHGIKVLFLTQPMLWKENPSPEEEAVNWLGTYEHQGHIYRLQSGTSAKLLETLNQHLMLICEEKHFECLDLAGRIPRSLEAFYDPVHFNEQGARMVAEAVRDALLARAFFNNTPAK